MRPSTVNCPSCSAPIEDLGAEIAECMHCGRHIRLADRADVTEDVQPPTPDGPPPDPTWGAILWARFRPHRRAAVQITAAALVVLSGWIIQTFYTYRARSAYGEEAITAGVLIGVSAILLLATRRKLTAIAIALFGGVVLFSKPFLYPMWSDVEEQRVFRLMSETHLNFLVPGALLALLALIFALTIRPTPDEEP
ncbi:MAG: hypothetical protein AAF389_05365 [Gemmatimonadota bacterium]